MAVGNVGVYVRWLGDVPEDDNGKPIPRSLWIRKRRHRWVVRWHSTDWKTRYGKVLKTRKEAKSFALEIQNRVNTGRADKPKKITLRQFRIEHLRVMKGQVSYGTWQEHKRALELFENFIGGSVELGRIRPADAEAFVADRLASKEVSVATVNKYIRTLKSIFNRAITPRGYLAEGQNPFIRIKRRKVTDNKKRYVEVSEYKALMDAAEDSWWKTFIAVAYSSGLRLNEILHLTWKDIDFDNQWVNVTAKKAKDRIIAWEPKGRKNRVVPISEEALKLLVDIQVSALDGHPYIFIAPQRLERITERIRIGKWNERSEVIHNMTRNFNRIRTRARVDKCTIHDLRRSAITNWSKKLPIQVTHKLAGHSNIKTTLEYYLVVRPEDFKAAGEVVNEILQRAEN
ncbi:MAG: tyrosine-type recombinase/integrase [Planctomycetota bacterium]|jgi:integrase